MIGKILIANRGEIAVRVIRTARAMGIRTVAVYSDADSDSLHVALADEAIAIGGKAAADSYLQAEKILEACKCSSADAVHPGYGFLSENAEFSELCATNGLAFIGPSAAAMRRIGSKIEAKQLAVAQGVPIAPGFFEPGADATALLREATNIGFPVMLKASAGGGGRGMRIVREPSQFLSELAIASDEALKGFGDGSMMVEKLVVDPRHIETQILADRHGNVAVLFERECSIQRRHQKLIEEAPSPLLAKPQFEHLWPKIRDASVALAKGSEYVGAGTVEFMVDESSGEFYFLEVNARLQVEHPVTEAISGIDLVRQQILIAQGHPLELPVDLTEGRRSALNGWSIEARVVAEDPRNDFRPSIGTIEAWAEPKAPGIRIDTGYGPKSEISRYYDSLIAKVVAHGASRGEAIARLIGALEDFHVVGIRTNIAFLIDVLRDEEFAAGRTDTGFLARRFADGPREGQVPPELGAIANAALAVVSELKDNASSRVWAMRDDFRLLR